MNRLDKIIEFAHLWQPTSEKANGEDWNDDEEEEDASTIQSYDASRPLYSATGKPLNTGSSSSISIELFHVKLKDLNDPTSDRIGSLGRLLCLGLFELRRKQQLVQTVSGIYLTKHEIRVLKPNDMSSIRKVFITPSTMHYEGPYIEEACAVTRYFSDLQDCFLRVSFRDEGK
jgi:hypothetical protein